MKRPLPRNPVLGAITSYLAQSDRTHVELPRVPDRTEPTGNLVDLFREQLHLVGGKSVAAKDMDVARKHIAELCASKGLHRLTRSDGELVEELLSEGVAVATIASTVEDRTELFTADAGLTDAQWGIAETGTLVLASSSERHRLTSLVPPTHIAIIPESRIVATMPTVLVQLKRSADKHQAVTFVTGPSRTADIELTLVVGVHGPKELHVVILLDR